MSRRAHLGVEAVGFAQVGSLAVGIAAKRRELCPALGNARGPRVRVRAPDQHVGRVEQSVDAVGIGTFEMRSAQGECAQR